jgi:lipopolysaccharide export system permease protein
MVLAPLAIILTKRATDDKGFSLNFDWLTNIYNRMFPSNEEQSLTMQTVTTDFVTDMNVEDIKAYIDKDTKNSNSKLKNVKPPSQELTGLSITEITKKYTLYSLVALVANIGLLIISYFGMPETLLMISITAVSAVIFFFTVWKAQQLLKTLTEQNGKSIDIPLFFIIAGGFPFYFLFFVYNRIFVNQLDTTPNTKV